MTREAELGLVRRTATTPFGELSYVGPPERTSTDVVLFLHGFGSSWAVWAPVIAAARSQGLLTGRDVVAVDLPGFGQSENRLGHLRAAEVGRSLLDFVHGLGYTHVQVAGHSMGGFLTLDMAVRFPKEIGSIHIVSGSYFTLLNMVNRPVSTFLRHPLVGSFYAFQVFLSYHDQLSSALNKLLERRATARPGAQPHYLLGGPAFRYGAANGRGYDAPMQWAQITIPVYGAFGASDRLVTPADMRTLQAVLPEAKLTLIAGTGHSSLVTHPGEVARALFAHN